MSREGSHRDLVRVGRIKELNPTRHAFPLLLLGLVKDSIAHAPANGWRRDVCHQCWRVLADCQSVRSRFTTPQVVRDSGDAGDGALVISSNQPLQPTAGRSDE
jgi:hypothetical protein